MELDDRCELVGNLFCEKCEGIVRGLKTGAFGTLTGIGIERIGSVECAETCQSVIELFLFEKMANSPSRLILADMMMTMFLLVEKSKHDFYVLEIRESKRFMQMEPIQIQVFHDGN